MPRDFNDFEVAARESAAAYDGKLGRSSGTRGYRRRRHEFWERVTS